MVVAVITARGGSKRIPGKNFKLFAGKPMLAWPITAAKEAGIFDRVIVSTDSPEIAAIARQWGAEVPFMRPAELSDDHTPTAPVFLHAL
jgi:N-acylneuraminate cytidylyltransferase